MDASPEQEPGGQITPPEGSVPHSEEQPGGAGEVADPLPGNAGQGRETTAREPRSPRPDLRTRGRASSAASSPQPVPQEKGPVQPARRFPPQPRTEPEWSRAARGGSGRRRRAGRGLRGRLAWDGGERFTVASSESPSPGARRSSPGAYCSLELPQP